MPKNAVVESRWKEPTIGSARVLIFMNTWANAVMLWPWFPVNFSPETVADGTNDSIYHMCVLLYHWGSTGVIKGPFSGELGVDELMTRGRLRAGWSQTSSGPPPCLVLERSCGSLGLCGTVRVFRRRGEEHIAALASNTVKTQLVKLNVHFPTWGDERWG